MSYVEGLLRRLEHSPPWDLPFPTANHSKESTSRSWLLYVHSCLPLQARAEKSKDPKSHYCFCAKLQRLVPPNGPVFRSSLAALYHAKRESWYRKYSKMQLAKTMAIIARTRAQMARERHPDVPAKGIRKAISDLTILSTDHLRSEIEWRRAYVVLSYMAQAYVWGGDTPEEVYLAVSQHLELPPILTYAGVVLWNFSSTTGDFSNPDSLKPLVSFTGTESETWFVVTSVAIEARSAETVLQLIDALGAFPSQGPDKLTAALVDLKQCIRDIDELLGRLQERCEPTVFYSQVRPFFAGGTALPNGHFYDEGSGTGKWRKLQGGSNAQSSLIHFFDIILGVEHSHAVGEESVHDQARRYIPGQHRRFLDYIGRLVGPARESALRHTSRERRSSLRTAFTGAVEALAALRSMHLRIAARYIIVPSRQSQSRAPHLPKHLGTAGTSFVPFLKLARDETFSATERNRTWAEPDI
ncbi:hypothetical protein PCL_08342 [Purpureocillium lilacinum]|uniref:Indoleamine 2,3-dioxygenase n=1 Tax=Purpureocillium lilacinum TaxID=33203 RepID=A0A2U3DRV2_PURLI|nr:hypothetical protein PCL_08342 [Purpureocillium lilacinum]